MKRNLGLLRLQAGLIGSIVYSRMGTVDISSSPKIDLYDVDAQLKQLFQTPSKPQDGEPTLRDRLIIQEEAKATTAVFYPEKRPRRWEKRYTPPRKSNKRFK